ncbi:tape measure protein [Stutzerimonas frequens]|uniref:tape measure protein n=1 Tax=Stutzerimonas frequens TaxID=2968969 RepID=UPI00190AFF58|nr:tape measure protein [Stutzerimonas frequens]MBK3870966.1 tape measure protein [Stutzerimonas frequens]MBK3909303.1 tape measure protein [Stutzerimonas frequens]
MATVKTQLVIDGKNNSKRAFDEVNSQINTMNKQLATAGKAIVAAFSVSALTGAIRGIANAADSYNLMNARLKLATGSQEEFNTAQTELRKIAIATQTPLESLATLYQRISRPLKEAGRSQADILKVTEAVATSFRVSGASAQEAENGVIQFAQALGSGALRGDEFNSVAEQAPRLMQALADSIGVPVGALKEMAAQGLLTADVVTSALVEQLAILRTEAESLPETVGGAMTALSDQWNEAVGQTNVQPLIDAINSLGETLSDPAVVANLVALASALAALAGTAVDGASEFVDLGKRIAYVAANSQGMVSELDKVDQQIKDLDRSLKGTGLNTTIDGLLFSTEELQAKREALVAFRAAIVEEQTGMNAELEFLADVANAAAEAAQQQDIDQRSKYIGELKSQQDQMVKAAQTASKSLVAAEKKANSELKKVRNARLDIEKRYQDAIAGMNSGGEASYGAAQALKVGAREALRAGDVEGAQAKAQAALKMLQDLQAAGANTYGFAGFVGELRDIELAANDIEQSRAEQKIADIKQEMVNLKTAAAALEDMPVSVKMDDAALAQVQAALDALAKREIIVKVGAEYDFSQPYTLQDPGPDPQKYATGGYISGPGTGTSDSIPALLSNGEYVIRAAAVRKLGKRHLDMLNHGIPIPRFADGGMVGTVASLDTSPEPIGRVDLNFGGDTIIEMLATPGQADQLRIAAKKFGRTHRS